MPHGTPGRFYHHCMRIRELLRLALRGLRRQTTRTLLTMLGVAVAACLLAFSVSLMFGLRGMVEREFRERPGFWEIEVRPGDRPPPLPVEQIPPEAISVEGQFDHARMQRIRFVLAERYRRNNATSPPAELTDESLARLAALPGVADVLTARWGQGHVFLHSRSNFATIVSGRCEQPMFRERIVAGRPPGPNECAVTEMLLYDLGFRSDADMAALLGQPLQIELGAHRDELLWAIDRLNLEEDRKELVKGLLAGAAPRSERAPARGDYTIAAILRSEVESDRAQRGAYQFRWGNVFLDHAGGEGLFRQMAEFADGTYTEAEVRITPGADLRAAVSAIEGLGFRTVSFAEWFDKARREVTLIGAGLNVFALVALLVAALGITNTFATSVVERTREIGMLKTVGATAAQVRWLFLAEGAMIGLAGGVLGILAARLLAGPADAFVRRQVQSLMENQKMLTPSVFEFPLWLCVAAPAFAMTATTLAALYPAHRAARIAPVEALRYG